MKETTRREALKFGIAGVTGLAVASVIKEAAAAPPAPTRTLLLPMPPLDLAAGATVFWSTEPIREAFRPDSMLLFVAQTAAQARQGLASLIAQRIELRRVMVGEKDQFIGLLPSSLADLPVVTNRSHNILSVDLRGVALQLEPGHPLVLEIHNPTDQVWHLRGSVFGNKPI